MSESTETTRRRRERVVQGNMFRNDVWALLVQACGAQNSTSARREFVAQVYWSGGRLYVDCYGEDRTDERADIIEVTNEALSRLLAEHVELYEVGVT